MSSALIHYHFETRDALLAEALEYSYTHAGEVRIAGDGEMAGASHAERLQSMIDGCLPTTPGLTEDWVLWVELWVRAARHPDLRPVAEELYARLHAWFGTRSMPASRTVSSPDAIPTRSPTARWRCSMVTGSGR